MQKQNCVPTKTLILEGNIGVGKSTFLKILKEKLNVDIIFEPTDKWQNLDEGGNLLGLFYKDAKRWAYTFQCYAFITRIQSLVEHEAKSTGEYPVQILERSVYCDRFCFAKNCYESGKMSALEWQIYQEWFGWLVKNYTKKPHGFIYLQADPEVCHQRIVKRSRSEEESIALSYLQELNKKHNDWLVDKKEVMSYLADVPVLVLDCNTDFEGDLTIQRQHLDSVQSFVDRLDFVVPGETGVKSLRGL